MLYSRGPDARIGRRMVHRAKFTAYNHCPNADIWSDTLTHRRVRALGVATTTDNVCSFRLAFAIRAAIIAVFPGYAVATGMGTFLLGFHAYPTCTLSTELLPDVFNSRSIRRSKDRLRSRESSCPTRRS